VHRVFRDELMDQPDLDPRLLEDDLRRLATLNRWFGGQQVLRKRVSPLLDSWRSPAPLRVLDIGTGAGDLCAVLLRQARRRRVPVRLLSLDSHPQTQAIARRALTRRFPETQFVQGDARALPLRDRSVDLAVCTLALHHFTNEDAVTVLREMRRVSRRWAVVSDLVRSPLALASVWFITRFTRNPLTRHDGPVSVRRAFTEPELRDLCWEGGWQPLRAWREPWFRQTAQWTAAEEDPAA
jgi:SAM-dependent methyltransferase